MDKIAVIYWSQTGNTEAMAKAIADGARAAGAAVYLMTVDQISVADAAGYHKLLLGCPAMGDEVLEEEEFEPFFTDLETRLQGKKVALFGSYDWGDGQWMRDWQERTTQAGATLFQDEGLILHELPDADELERCQAFGRGFAAC